MLWFDKYKPTKITDYLGNKNQLDIASKLIRNFSKSGIYKPLIIYGDRGVGKTTLAHLILERNNYFIINLDYESFSDRSKIRMSIDQYLNSNTLDKLMFNKKRKKGILIDDIDCIPDKFVSKDIITIIKKKNKMNKLTLPVIFTCKDNKKVKDIRGKCIEVKLYPPTKITLFKYGKKIINGEKLSIDDSALNYFVKHSQGDFRKLSNILYYVHLTIKSEQFTIEDTLSIMDKIIAKNKILNVYEISNIALNNYSNINKMLHLCETEKTLSGLMMHENYVSTIIDNRKGSSKKKLRELCKISESLSIGDIFRTNIIIRKIGWELDKYCIFLENVYPSYIINNNLDKYVYNRVNNINFTKMLSNKTQTYNNYKYIYSNKLLKNLEYDNFIVIKILLDGLFLEGSNTEAIFGLIYKYNIKFDFIDKFIHLFNKDYKKLYSKKKKKKIIKNYNAYIRSNLSSELI